MNGLYAAVATPVRETGDLDLDTLDRLVDFLTASAVDGLCVGGATGEYPHFEAPARRAVVERVMRRLPAGRALLAGVGAPSPRLVGDLGRAALDAGCAAVLVPMPMFFRYEQQDLAAYAGAAARHIAGPCLLYDLPDFTNPLQPGTAIQLMRDEPHVTGIKDSSGCQPHLAQYASARGESGWTLFVGDDRLLFDGLTSGWNGGISGVAGFCPELLAGLYRSHRAGDRAESARLHGLLLELISRMAVFPTPWGIRLGLAARGIDTGPLPLPLSDERRRQAREFQGWLPGWLEQHDLRSAR